MTPIRTLVAGLGNMGRSHALAYHADPAFEIVGLVNRSPRRPPRRALRPTPWATDFPEALARLKPDLVSIATYSDSHADYAVAAMEAGAHVFVEKPLATTAADAERVAAKAARDRPQGRRRLHPAPPPVLAAADRRGPRAWAALTSSASTSTSKSSGPTWEIAQGADADHLADRRLRRALRRRHVPDHRRRAGRGPRHGPAPLRRDRRRTCTTTATSRCSSPTARSAGTRPAGAR